MGPKKKSNPWYKAPKSKKNKKVEPVSPVSDGELEQDPEACRFCHLNVDSENLYGKFLNKDGIVTHYFCMLFASGLGQNGCTETDGILGFLPKDINRELSRGHRFKCIYCRKRGATIGCCKKSCRAVFHFNCGQENGALNQFFGNFSSFCGVHRLKQITPSSDRLAFHGTAVTNCAICMCSVEARASNDTLRTPCCKNSWYHRECIQNQALSAGLHFFKCPLCNNKDNFQKEMLTFGIYIPDQDAAWEREANAFQELLDRHSRCDVKTCLCQNGRTFKTSGKFNIALCDLCGSQGTHLACSNLKSEDSAWACPDCKKVQVKDKKKKVPSPGQATVKSKSPQNFASYLEEKGRSSYIPTKAFPAKKGQKRKCSAAEGRPSAKRCRIMECSVRLTSIDKQLEEQEICGKRCLLSPGRTSVKFFSKEQVRSKQLSEDMRKSKLDISRFRKKLEAIKQQRLKMESAPSPSKVITSPITGKTIDSDNLRRKIRSLNDPSISPFSNDGLEFGSVVKSSSPKSFGSEFVYLSPFPRKSSILCADTSMKSSPITPKSPMSFGDRTPGNSSFTLGVSPSSSSSSDFTPKGSANFRKQTTPYTSTGSPVFIPARSSSVGLQTPQSSSKSPGLLTGSSRSSKSINKFQVVSHDDTFSTPKFGCRTPQVEVSSAGTHVVHNDCNSEGINRNVGNVGNKSWSTCSLHSVSRGLHSKRSLNHIHSEPRQSVKRLDFLEEIEKYGKDLKSTIQSPGSQSDQNLTNAANSFRLYPSQVPLSKPEFDRLWSSSSSGSETESPCQKQSSKMYPRGKWYYLPKGVDKVAKHSFMRLQQSGLRSSSVIKPNVAVGLRRRDSKSTRYRSAPTSPGCSSWSQGSPKKHSPVTSATLNQSPYRRKLKNKARKSMKSLSFSFASQSPELSCQPFETSPHLSALSSALVLSDTDDEGPESAVLSPTANVPREASEPIPTTAEPEVIPTTSYKTTSPTVTHRSWSPALEVIPAIVSTVSRRVSSPNLEVPPASSAPIVAQSQPPSQSTCEKLCPVDIFEAPSQSTFKKAQMTSKPNESDPILPLVVPTHPPVVVIDDDDDDLHVKGKSSVVEPSCQQVVIIYSDDDDLVDLTAEDDDDSVCIIESSFNQANQNVVSVPGHLQKNMTLFRGPANKVLIPVAAAGLSQPARASIGLVSIEPIVIADDDDDDGTTKDDPSPLANQTSDIQGRPVGRINPFQLESH
ncbi:uncharacterized protein LOC135484197 isoform X2 [Lineus longissimus]|uniref:uncharacterized protein LOC135484197 isoform X2 n=1 Tax=Lineus longissimus TaxID=88925 RepID=UPI00315C75C3